MALQGRTGTISSQLHEGDEHLRKECITAPMADGRAAGEREMRFGLAELRRCTVTCSSTSGGIDEQPPTYTISSIPVVSAATSARPYFPLNSKNTKISPTKRPCRRGCANNRN